MRTDYAGPAKRALAGLVVGTLIAGVPLLPTARPDRPEPARSRSVTPRADLPALAEEAGDLGCQSARRKLWVDGRGWVVRQTTRCI